VLHRKFALKLHHGPQGELTPAGKTRRAMDSM
jgi:hypothetical protein